MIDDIFWKNKRVFLTGHTGFKGSWLSIWLSTLGANVKGYALCPPTTPNLFEIANIEPLINSEIGDIRNREQLTQSMLEFEPDIVIHMAAQPLVRYSYDHPIETYDVNVMGTLNVLEAARKCPRVKCIVSVTTDKCYENQEKITAYKETDKLGGYDPYSSSKACAELVISSYRQSFMQNEHIALASVRAGNVIGGGDWAEDRLVPDILRSFEKNEPVVVRSPKSIRPWQHVLEPLSGYLFLVQQLYSKPKIFDEAWNFGPEEKGIKTVEWIVNFMAEQWGNSTWELDTKLNPHEAKLLTLDSTKAKQKLHWTSVWSLNKTLHQIIKWHKYWLSGKDMQRICINEINHFTQDMCINLNEK